MLVHMLVAFWGPTVACLSLTEWLQGWHLESTLSKVLPSENNVTLLVILQAESKTPTVEFLSQTWFSLNPGGILFCGCDLKFFHPKEVQPTPKQRADNIMTFFYLNTSKG